MGIPYYSWGMKDGCTFSARRENIKIENQNFYDY